jgi:hypothetical protein
MRRCRKGPLTLSTGKGVDARQQAEGIRVLLVHFITQFTEVLTNLGLLLNLCLKVVKYLGWNEMVRHDGEMSMLDGVW